MRKSAASRWWVTQGNYSRRYGPALRPESIPYERTTVIGDFKIGYSEVCEELANQSKLIRILATVLMVGLCFPVFFAYHFAFWASWERRVQNWNTNHETKSPPRLLRALSAVEGALWAALVAAIYLASGFISFVLINP